MFDSTPIQDMPVLQISELLEANNHELTATQVVQRRDFIDQIGGIENARAAVRLLAALERQ